MATVNELIKGVTDAARRTGVRVTEADVGFIVGMFFEGVIHAIPSDEATDLQLQQVADECNAIAGRDLRNVHG